jgi:hypothetical protein
MRRMAAPAKLHDQPINIRLPRELHQEVLDRSAADERTLAQTVRVALRYYLQNTTPVIG